VSLLFQVDDVVDQGTCAQRRLLRRRGGWSWRVGVGANRGIVTDPEATEQRLKQRIFLRGHSANTYTTIGTRIYISKRPNSGGLAGLLMDSSQHYQPLSHALNPALAGAPSRSPYSTSSVYTPPPQLASIPAVRQPQPMQEDLQDDEDQEDDDEGIVEGQLELNSHDRREAPPASPPRTTLYVTRFLR
jgi:hypothetical protein